MATYGTPGSGVPHEGAGVLSATSTRLGLVLVIAQMRRHLRSLSVHACHRPVLASKATRLGTLQTQ
jgi:hypothetical protein